MKKGLETATMPGADEDDVEKAPPERGDEPEKDDEAELSLDSDAVARDWATAIIICLGRHSFCTRNCFRKMS